MTHTELYEIVKDHPDVWGQHFHTVRRSNETTELVRHFSNEQPEPEHLGAELLGLGVAWLVERIEQAIIGKHCGKFIIRDGWMPPNVSANRASILAAVYAAIADVKRSAK